MKFKRKPYEVEAIQWFKNGDHPDDNCPDYRDEEGKPFQGEGKVVRYFRHPDVDGSSICPKCGNTMHNHGWLDSGRDGKTVCPGDWIVSKKVFVQGDNTTPSSYYKTCYRAYKSEVLFKMFDPIEITIKEKADTLINNTIAELKSKGVNNE